MKYEKISQVVKDKVPEFVKTDYGTFVNFLEAYFRFLEKENEVFINTSDSVSVLDSSTVLDTDLIERPSALDQANFDITKNDISDVGYTEEVTYINTVRRIPDDYVTASELISISLTKIIAEGPYLLNNLDYVDIGYFATDNTITDTITSLVTA